MPTPVRVCDVFYANGDFARHPVDLVLNPKSSTFSPEWLMPEEITVVRGGQTVTLHRDDESTQPEYREQT